MARYSARRVEAKVPVPAATMLLSVERVVKVLMFLFRGLWFLLLFGNVELKRFWWDAAACCLTLELVELFAHLELMYFLCAAEALMGRRRHDDDVVIVT